jgi:phosphatidylglycerophosphate synthase
MRPGGLPNVLSASRIIFAFGVIALSARLDVSRYVATVVLSFAALITDFFDGYLARRWRVNSATGYILDSLGDRAMHLSLVLVFLVRYNFHPVFAWLIIFRDLGMFSIRVLCPEWLSRSISLQWLSRAQAIALRIWMGMFFLRDGCRLFGHSDIGASAAFARAQAALLFTTIVLAYYGLLRSLMWLIDREHEAF